MLHNFDGKRNFRSQSAEITKVVNKEPGQIDAQLRREVENQKALLIEKGATIVRVKHGTDSSTIIYTKPRVDGPISSSLKPQG